jgi:hypothetical protein
VRDLGEQVARGNVVLFTGAGFSRAATNVAGRPVPSTAELIELLWPLAFPDENLDDSSVGDVYACACAVQPEATGELLRDHLTVRVESLPEVYRLWFSLPWARIYTLNVDDLDEAVARKFPLPVAVRPLSALREGLPERGSDLLCIHLNGRIADYPDITFSLDQYGERTAAPDPWYQLLAVDLLEHPILFVGTQLEESPLWHQLALRRPRQRDASRPRSYLVSPKLPRARRQMLEDLNVEWIAMDHEEFADDVLAGLEHA